MGAEESSFCPHCGRETPTIRGGSCVECWQPKSATARPAIPPPEPKTERLFDFSLDFELIPAWVWLALVSAILSILFFGIRSAL